jgi:hypothetical protein
VGCSGPGCIRTGMKERRVRTVGKDMKNLSKCWCQVPEV